MRKLNPWRGLVTYEDNNPQFPFCGRRLAINELREEIDNNIVSTLYGKSGVGKSSLLRAGLFPLMRTNGYMPVYIRLQELSAESDYWTSIYTCIENEVKRCGYTNQRTDSAVSAYDFFFSLTIKDQDGDVIFPLVVFDQLEETLISFKENEQIVSFFRELYEITETGLREEIYSVRFLLSIREDDLYLLEDCIDTLHLYKLKESRYRLRQMNKEEACEVILKPGEELFEDNRQNEYCSKILSLALADIPNEERYDVLILSLVCAQLYEFSASRGHEIISVQDLSEFSQGEPLTDFYREVAANLPEEAIQYIETRLIDDTGRRRFVPYDEFSKYLPTNLLNSNQSKTGNELTKGAILQTININHGIYVELLHDRLAKVIAAQRDKRQLEKERRARFNRFKWGGVLLVLVIPFLLILAGIHHQVSYPLEKQEAFVDSLPLRVGIGEPLPLQKMRSGRKWTSIHVNFFHKSMFSFGNHIYRYDDSDTTWEWAEDAATVSGLKEYILPYGISMDVYPPTQRVILLQDPLKYGAIYVHDTARCELYIPYSSMPNLLKRTDWWRLSKFSNIQEMSMLQTWWLKMRWNVIREFHGVGTDGLGQTVLKTPFSRLRQIILLLFLIPLICCWAERKRAKKNALEYDFAKSYICYFLPTTIAAIISYFLMMGFDLDPFFPIYVPLLMIVVIWFSRKIEVLSQVERWFMGELGNITTTTGRLKYNITLFGWLVFLTCLYWATIAVPSSNILLLSIYPVIAFLSIVYVGRLRCHDLGKNGWWQLVPGYIFVMIFAPGKSGTNDVPSKSASIPGGRMSRHNYVLLATSLLIGLIVCVVTYLRHDSTSFTAYCWISGILYSVVHVCAIDRCHDAGLEGKYSMIPLYIFVLMFKKEDENENRYGAPISSGAKNATPSIWIGLFVMYVIVCLTFLI